MKAELGWRCEGEAAPGPYSTSTARMLLPGTLGNSRSKIFVTLESGAFVSSAITLVVSSAAPANSSKAIVFIVTLLSTRGSDLCACPIGKTYPSGDERTNGGQPVFVEDRSEVLRLRIGNDLPLVADRREKPL